jgi:Pyruvate/2-oxoacid:ferredoxin oxidoreductase gamma subunit
MEEIFESKGRQVIDINIKAIDEGYKAIENLK